MTAPVPMPVSVPPALLHARRSPLSWVTMIVLGLGGLLIAILVLISAGPGGALVITLLAAVSFPVLILICFWLDRYEPEPGRYRLAALGWGAVVAVGFSLVTEQVLFAVPDTSDFIDTAVTAPVLEELGKGLFLVAIVIFRREQVHGILDGIVYAALVGIGFAFVEDILYYLGSLNSDLASVFLVRGIIGPFAHPLFTSATGIGIGIAVTTKRPVVRIVAPIAGYLLAVAMHAIWNGSLFWGGRGFFTAYGVIILPLLVVIMVLAIWARSQEGKLLEASLSGHRPARLDQTRGDSLDLPAVGPDVGPRVRQTTGRQVGSTSPAGLSADADRGRLPASPGAAGHAAAGRQRADDRPAAARHGAAPVRDPAAAADRVRLSPDRALTAPAAPASCPPAVR